jgi:hypothetical protein
MNLEPSSISQCGCNFPCQVFERHRRGLRAPQTPYKQYIDTIYFIQTTHQYQKWDPATPIHPTFHLPLLSSHVILLPYSAEVPHTTSMSSFQRSHATPQDFSESVQSYYLQKQSYHDQYNTWLDSQTNNTSSTLPTHSKDNMPVHPAEENATGSTSSNHPSLSIQLIILNQPSSAKSS